MGCLSLPNLLICASFSKMESKEPGKADSMPLLPLLLLLLPPPLLLLLLLLLVVVLQQRALGLCLGWHRIQACVLHEPAFYHSHAVSQTCEIRKKLERKLVPCLKGAV